MFGSLFKQNNAPKRRQLKLDLNSDISINLIDVAHIDLHPEFKIPDQAFFIKAIGYPDYADEQRDVFNVYATNNKKDYLIEIEAVEDKIQSVNVYTHIWTEEAKSWDQWTALQDSVKAQNIALFGIEYKRAWGGDAETANLLKSGERIKTKNGEILFENQIMEFGRTIEPFNFTEKVRAVAETNLATERRLLNFYVGFSVHPSVISILGN